jgi:hypothetical protein
MWGEVREGWGRVREGFIGGLPPVGFSYELLSLEHRTSK